jgi:hypothetical protein
LKIAPVRAERIYSDARCDRVYDLWDAMTPFSTGGVYANNLGEEGIDRGSSGLRRELSEAGCPEKQI